MTIMVTGANGFVGRPLCAALASAGQDIVAAVRPQAVLPEGVRRCSVAGLAASTDWQGALAGASAVVHLAARVHVMHDTSVDPLAEFRAANVAGTLALAEQAAAAGVRHLVFLSSIKANGEETKAIPFGPDMAAPVDPYGISKREAELGLAALAARTGLAVTVLRPPLVYGPWVKGNLRRLIQAIDRGLPLPLGRVDNRRALIGIDNLTAAIGRALDRPPAPGVCRIYTLCDDETVSTPALIRRLAAALDRPARLLPVPVGWLRLAGRLSGRSAAIQRLTGSLEIDDRLIRAELDWTPPVSLESGLAAMAAWWRADSAAAS
jgi:UDP-glucose 4-epimerase